MRIWDLPAGYLNRGSLLGEHRELHGLLSILVEGKRGYARHPETVRWVGCESGLARRHSLLREEMRQRGYVDRTPIEEGADEPVWPEGFIDPPARQFELLAAKYEGKEGGRIPLPRNATELWAQHKYSVLARDPEIYREIGRRLASDRLAPVPEGEGREGDVARGEAPKGRAVKGEGMAELARELVGLLRRRPPAGPLRNAIEHMWGHVEKAASPEEREEAERNPAARLAVVQRVTRRTGEPYLQASTALTELAVYVAR